jgi:hypothetical protein
MGDILKEAIADAKAVRETALENAKMALEEAFTPQIKSMLSAKLKEEEDDETEEGTYEGHDDEEAEEGMHDEGEHEEPEETYEDEEVPAEEGEHEDPEEGEHEDPEEGEHEDEVEEEGLELEDIIRELEAELSEGEDDDDDEVTEGEKEDDDTVEEEYEVDESIFTEDEDEDDDTVDEELDKSSDIGKGDNNRGSTDASSGIGSGKKGMKESSELEAELKEYKEAVHFLKDKLHEVNILNAKLLFTNKLFKQYSLDNNQKLKVVETFDRAQTTREIKLVYSTLAEQFSDNGSIVTKKSISESASTAVSSTKPSKESKKVISEEVQVADRFRKLAGLIK